MSVFLLPRRARARLAAPLALLCGLLWAGQALAAQTVTVQPEAMAGYGRLVLEFENLPAYEVRSSTGVVVVAFGESVELDVSRLATVLRDYVGAARLDPDGRAMRMALSREATINTMEAGDLLFIDFLPPGWRGLPPGLPEEVVAELARRAKQAEEDARIEALRQAGLMPNPDVELGIGEHPTFSRLEFRWDRHVQPVITRDGTMVRIDFRTRGQVDLARLRAHRPRLLRHAEARLEDDKLVVELEVERVASVRGFADGNNYVVDISDASDPSRAAMRDAAREALPELLMRDVEGVMEDEGVGAAVTDLAGNGGAVPSAASGPALLPPVSVRFQPFDAAGLGPAAFADAADEPALPARAAPEARMVPEALETREVQDGEAASAPPAAAPPAASSMPAEAGAPVAVRTQSAGSSVSLIFPFPEMVAASVFTRAGVLWAVFDSDVPIDVSAIAGRHADRILDISVTRSGAMQYVRVHMANRDLATASAQANEWVVTIGDTVLEPTRPLALTRRAAADGNSLVSVELKDAGRVHWIRDPQAGDMLAVVTAHGPPRGLIKPQDFVEFTAFASTHGVALRPIADDVRVTLRGDELIVSRGGGLSVSAGGAHQYAAGRADMGFARRPGFIDFAAMREGGPGEFLAKRQAYETQTADAVEGEGAARRLALARFYIGHGLAAEALSVLDTMSAQDAAVIRDPSFNAARAIANIMMNRSELAREDLAVHGLSQSLDATLWRGVMETAAGNWRTAQLAFEEADPVIGDYPPEWQARFRLDAALAALETRDLAGVHYQLDGFPADTASVDLEARAALLRARYLQELGRSDDALRLYRAVAASSSRPAAAEAGVRQVALLAELDRITEEESIDQLEAVAFTWRGDATELRALRMLAGLHAGRGEYRRAFEALRAANMVDSAAPTARRIQEEMAAVFEDLFLHGKADELATVDALSLFYDFRNMTPVGRQGDEMIRRLADRLIGLDLLDQAAQLLEYQVENRLHGAGRAQIAAQLAMVYLRNHQPARALRVLQQTRMAALPGELQRQRDLLQARGLSETGRHEQALDLLDVLQGDDIDRLRADTLWQARRWQEAAEQIERLLGGAWQDSGPLDDEARYNVMRAAISYSLAEDQLGLDRLRTKFAAKMADSPDARSFQVVTAPVAEKGVAFDDLARAVAGIDTLTSFLEDVRARFAPGGHPPAAGGDAAAQGAPHNG